MSKHPECNWAIILQQAWSMKLKDRIVHQEGFQQFSLVANSNNGRATPPSAKFNEACRRYNKGKCKYGPSCHYEHKCSYCGKFGHPILKCHKLAADKEHTQNSRENKDLCDSKDKV